jgi:hypothetical protein
MTGRLWVALLVVALGAGCSGPSEVPGQVPAGLWGGDHLEMVVAADAARLEFDCAHGSIPGSIPVRDGLIDVAGVFVPEHGGPIVAGEVLPERPARYRGALDGQRLTLAVEAEGLGDLGSFSLELGHSGRLVKCQ